jgi:hypothetical protein
MTRQAVPAKEKIAATCASADHMRTLGDTALHDTGSDTT